MSPFDSVPPPTWDQAAGESETIRQIDDWLGSEPVVALVQAFGGTLKTGPSAAYADSLREFAQSHWDFRKGQERDTARRQNFDGPTVEIVQSAAEALGLVDAIAPRKQQYDAFLVLGGLIRACITRPRYAADLMASGIHAKEVVGLSAFRQLSRLELELGQRLGLKVNDEFDAMTQGMRRALESSVMEPPTTQGKDVPGAPSRSWRMGGRPSGAARLRSRSSPHQRLDWAPPERTRSKPMISGRHR
jgi:hypothetical protein